MQPEQKSILPQADDGILLVCHQVHHKSPIRAYFEEDDGCFYAAEDVRGFPLMVTHWMKMPQFDLNESH